MKQEPMSDALLALHINEHFHHDMRPDFQHYAAFAQAIIADRDKQWADLVDAWTVECLTADVVDLDYYKEATWSCERGVAFYSIDEIKRIIEADAGAKE